VLVLGRVPQDAVLPVSKLKLENPLETRGCQHEILNRVLTNLFEQCRITPNKQDFKFIDRLLKEI
jgi:hypothetical protein